MEREAANERLVFLVNAALDAGLQGRPKPEAIPLDYDVCTDDLLGPIGEVRPVFDYSFPLSVLGDDVAEFVEMATDVWETEGLQIINRDDEDGFLRFASDENFHLKVSALRTTGEVIVSGSGPCVKDPD
jgi:hypothetical protein